MSRQSVESASNLSDTGAATTNSLRGASSSNLPSPIIPRRGDTFIMKQEGGLSLWE